METSAIKKLKKITTIGNDNNIIYSREKQITHFLNPNYLLHFSRSRKKDNLSQNTKKSLSLPVCRKMFLVNRNGQFPNTVTTKLLLISIERSPQLH